MKLTEKLIHTGTGISWGVYYTNKEYQYLSSLPDEVFDLTVGGLPEMFGAASSVLVSQYLAKNISKQFNKVNFENSIETIKEWGCDHAKELATLASAIGIITFGIVDETIYNISNGTQDPTDIAKYAVGALTGAYVGLKKE